MFSAKVCEVFATLLVRAAEPYTEGLYESIGLWKHLFTRDVTPGWMLHDHSDSNIHL